MTRPTPTSSNKKTISKTISWLALLFLCAQVTTLAQDLTVNASFKDKPSVARSEAISLILSRGLKPSEGKLAVFIGHTDVTTLFSPAETVLTYSPQALPLPVGETALTVYLVTPDDQWKQLAEFPLRVAPLTREQPPGPASGRKNGFDKASFTPSLTIGMKAQVDEYHYPESNRPERLRYADFTLQGSLRTEIARGLFNSQSQFDIVGTSYRREALRFSQEGDNAPRIDLSSYLLQFQAGKVKAMVGHVSFGSYRHLINSFSSRGITLTFPLTSRSDFSVGAFNGTSVVGWNNFFGLGRQKHRIVTGSFGFEFDRERPGRTRLEAGVLHGSLLPFSNANQSNVTDAERSRGASLRLTASDRSQRFSLDAGFSRSSFNNPSDVQLDQGFTVVPVRETARNARYLDASVDILRNVALTETKKASLTMTYRHETVDPLFRSVAAFTQADRFQNQLEASANVADVTATFAYNRFNDNLDDIPSILKLLSRRTGIIVGAPLVSLFGNPAKPSPWFPRLSYNFERFHQLGAGMPVNGDFTSPSQIPDQISTNQSLFSEWQTAKWRFGYRLNHSFQNNRQVGREVADLLAWVNGFTFGFTPVNVLDLSLDINAESARNNEQRRTDNTNRVGVMINWRMTANHTLATSVSAIFAGDNVSISSRRNAELDVQWSYRFTAERSRFKKVQGQFFARYANRYARAFDGLFGFRNLTKLQTFNTGLTFTFF
jgi:hypothetical protein